MSRNVWTRAISVHYHCDKRSCDGELAVPVEEEDSLSYRYEKKADKEAVKAGWSAWRGSRSRFYYCPEHGPGHQADVWRLW